MGSFGGCLPFFFYQAPNSAIQVTACTYIVMPKYSEESVPVPFALRV
jgi:hypothetical protein